MIISIDIVKKSQHLNFLTKSLTVKGGDCDMFMKCFQEDLTSSKSNGESTKDHEKYIHRLNTRYGFS